MRSSLYRVVAVKTGEDPDCTGKNAGALSWYRGELNEGSPFVKTITEPFAFSARTRPKSSWAKRPRLPNACTKFFRFFLLV